MDEEALSYTTASSSGIPNCDITVLGHQSITSLVQDVERQLKRKGYTVAIPLAAGRPIQENLISRVKHAKVTIIILKKKSAKDFQSFLQVLPPKPDSGSLHACRTLILYEEGITDVRRAYKHLVRIKLSSNASKIAEQASCFLEAHNSTDINGVSDIVSFRQLFADFMLHSIINPMRTETSLKISLKELESRFQSRHGSFHQLHVESSSLKEHVAKSLGFSLEEDIVIQSADGALSASLWYARVQNPANLDHSKIRNFSTSLNSTKHQVLAHSNANLQEPQCLGDSQPQSTNEWVTNIKLSTVNSKGCENFKIDWTKTEALRKCVYEFDSRYSFVLISGKSTPADIYNGIVNIPWLKVFDFDQNSRESGLLSSAEAFLNSYTISTFQDTFKPLFNERTDWVFPLGFSSKPESIIEDDCLNWYISFKNVLEEQCSAISNFCVARTMPIFLILWYDTDDRSVKYLEKFFSILFPAVQSDTLQRKIILCCEAEPNKNSLLCSLIEDYGLKASTVYISCEDVFKYFAQAEVPDRSSHDAIKLPKATDGESVLDVVEIPKTNAWFKDYIEVLSSESQAEIAQRSTENLGMDFVKGSTVTWDELAAGTSTVPRDIKKQLSDCLYQDVIKDQKSIIIKILHAPGGGGTTFARQLLWDLHTKVPCGVVVPNLTLSVTQVTESIRFLHDYTRLPVVLLVDGRSNYEVEQLYEYNKYAVVILHVQRYNKDIPKARYTSSLRTCYLPGSITSTEARQITEVFTKFSPKSKNALTALTNDVVHGRKVRFIFEYGLTAFNHEFKGVRKYVSGYLQITHHAETIKNLESWQKVVAYLSLVLYYGQNGLHRETFHKLLKDGTSNEFVNLDDLPYSGRQFIIEIKNEWKISYNVVAIEILEQILSPSTNFDTSGDMKLTKNALNNLHELVIDFISMIKRAVKGGYPEPVLNILMTMIIRRDYVDVDMKDGCNRKCLLSKLLEQVPMPENRVKILRHLTHTFPKHTEFHAHLGRLLNLMGGYDEAEKSLQTALNIREKEQLWRDPSGSDDVLGRIHHMFGFGYLMQAKGELKKALKSFAPAQLIFFVNKACHHFSVVRRKVTQNLSYGYVGEVRSRLLIAEYVHKTFKNGCLRAFNDQLGKQHVALCELIRESHSMCDQLLAECRQYNPDVELRRLNDYGTCVDKFNLCFSGIRGDLPLKWNENETTIPYRRSQIASLKMLHSAGGNKQLPCIENIRSKDDIERIIVLHEKTLQEAFSSTLNNVLISLDAVEWLHAIRHPLAKDKYTLVKVLQTVSDWERRNEVGLATFYLYVINFVLALFIPGKGINEYHNNRAKEIKEKMQVKKYQHQNVWRLEWLAKVNGISIRKLVNKNELGIWDKETRFWKDEMSVKKLQVCTGTIVSSSHPLRGNISVDSQLRSRKNRIEVYFVPKLYNLCGARFADMSTRVEFCIGFSPRHGAEAFEIRRLERNFCLHCSAITETLTLNGRDNRVCSACRKSLKSS